MKQLTLFYDAHCGLCSSFREWLSAQTVYVPIRLIDYQSPEALRIWPEIRRMHPEREILALADDGRFYQGSDAWIMALWATRDYREWSQKFATPALKPLAIAFCRWISAHRHGISRLLRMKSVAEMESLFKRETPPPLCRLPLPGKTKDKPVGA